MDMMQVYKLDGNSVEIISCPPEDLRKGDYVLVEDVAVEAALIAQVVNTGYADVPGILRGSAKRNRYGRTWKVAILTIFRSSPS